MQFERIFILTGAGLSAESGLGTFRDKDGLWAKFNVAELASIGGYERDPARVLAFYNQRRAGLANAAPNPAHMALAQLQARWSERGGDVFLCTQNIDDLLERAGARRVVHMHGELNKTRCHECAELTPADGDILMEMGCSACGRIGCLRPHVVWFGEIPLFMDEIYAALGEADLFVAIGTSGAVYPAAGFVELARAREIPAIELNLAPSDNAYVFSDARYGAASEIVPNWVAGLLAAASV